MAERKYTAVDRTDICLNCKSPFSYPYTSGKRKEICSDKCKKEWRTHLAEIRISNSALCRIDGCNNKATRKNGVCETHYYRVRRTGLTSKKPLSGRYVTSAGYIKILDHGHPLADSSGQVFEHRYVVYEARKGISQPCYWCGALLNWKETVIDHLNENKQDNVPSNLVSSCNNCNRARGSLLPFIARMREDAVQQFVRSFMEYRQKLYNTNTQKPIG